MRSDRCPSCPVCDVDVLWPNNWMDQDETWHRGRPWPRPHCVRWGPSCPPEGAQPPHQLLAHICCGQTAGWIKMPLVPEVGLSPGDIVLDADSAPPKKGGTAARTIFDQCLLWPWLPISATAELLLLLGKKAVASPNTVQPT